jgi:hypothetical protein
MEQERALGPRHVGTPVAPEVAIYGKMSAIDFHIMKIKSPYGNLGRVMKIMRPYRNNASVLVKLCQLWRFYLFSNFLKIRVFFHGNSIKLNARPCLPVKVAWG